jgi:hypothetical protein
MEWNSLLACNKGAENKKEESKTKGKESYQNYSTLAKAIYQ